MIQFFTTVYFVITLPVFMLIWAMLVVAKRSDEKSGYDLLEDRISSK